MARKSRLQNTALGLRQVSSEPAPHSECLLAWLTWANPACLRRCPQQVDCVIRTM